MEDFASILYNSLVFQDLRDRLMVGHSSLKAGILVRIQVPQPPKFLIECNEIRNFECPHLDGDLVSLCSEKRD